MDSRNIGLSSRVSQVQTWLIEGKKSAEIYKLAVGKWKVSERTAMRLIKKAKEAFVQEQVGDIGQKRAYRVAQLEDQIRNMKPKYKGTPAGMAVVTRIIRQIKELEGLAAPVKHEFSGPDGEPIQHNNTTGPTVDLSKLSTATLDEILNARVKGGKE
jgi:hypothetical protein